MKKTFHLILLMTLFFACTTSSTKTEAQSENIVEKTTNKLNQERNTNIQITFDNYFAEDAFLKIDEKYHSATKIIKDKTGGHFLIINEEKENKAQQPLALLKIDNDLKTVWSKILNDKAVEIGADLQILENKIYITGTRRKLGVGANDFYLSELNISGQPNWSKEYGSNRNFDVVSKLVIQPNKEFFMIGRTVSPTGGLTANLFLVKTDSVGIEIKSKVVSDLGNSIGYDGIVMNDNSIIVLTVKSEKPKQLFLTKFDNDFNQIWNKNISEVTGDIQDGNIIQCDDGGFLLRGRKGFDELGLQVLLVKTDEKGEVIWSKTYGMNDRLGNEGLLDQGRFMKKVENDNYIIGGDSWSLDSGERVNFLFKVDSEGNLIWANAYEGNPYGTLVDLEMNHDNTGYIGCGYQVKDLYKPDTKMVLLNLDLNGRPRNKKE